MTVPRLLIVSHHFAPSTGTSGRRPTRLARYLCGLGCPPTVVTAAPEFYGDEVEPGPCLRDELNVVEVRRSRLCTRLEALGGPGWQARNVALLAAYRRAIARALANGPRPDFLWFRGVPFWYFPLSRYFRLRDGIPYVLDFGDVLYMRGITYALGQRSGLRHLTDRAGEAWAVGGAELVVHTTDEQSDIYRRRYAWKPRPRFATIRWGYDADELRRIRPARRRDDAFRLAIFGKFAAYGQVDAANLARCVAEIARDREVQVVQLGLPEPELVAAFGREGVAQRLQPLGMQPYGRGLELLASADCCVLNAISRVSMPVKAYDYIGLNRPILAFVEAGSAAERMLARFPGAFVVRSAEEAAQAVRQIADGVGELAPGIDTHEFSQQSQFAKLVDILTRLRDGRPTDAR